MPLLRARDEPDTDVSFLGMDFAYTAEDEAFRAELVDWLDENLEKFLADWPTGEDAEEAAGAGAGGIMAAMERRRAWQRKLNEGRWAAIGWPAGVGRPRRDGHPERHLQRDDGEVPHAGHLQRQRPVADRPDDHPLGHRRAEAAVGARTSSTPTTTGARASPSPRPDRISPTCARWPFATATTTC